MKKMKRPLAIASLICAAMLTALLATWLSAIVEGTVDPQDPTPIHIEDDGRRTIDWDSLPESVVAWVEVPGTSIDEPIVQATPDAPNYYLHVDALGQGAYGTPYIDCDCTIDSRFVMVYGHHMSDGSAFADFANYINEGYAKDHDKIIVYKRSGEVLELEPVAVDVVNASRETLVIDQEVDFAEVIAGSDVFIREPVGGEQLFAFTTCSYQTRNSRTTVFAMPSDAHLSMCMQGTPSTSAGTIICSCL